MRCDVAAAQLPPAAAAATCWDDALPESSNDLIIMQVVGVEAQLHEDSGFLKQQLEALLQVRTFCASSGTSADSACR